MHSLSMELLYTMKAMQNFKLPISPASEIIHEVCNSLDVQYHDVTSSNRNTKNSEARYIIFHLLKNHTKLSLKEIGAAMGGKHHTTVIHGLKVFQSLIDSKDKPFLNKIATIAEEAPQLEIFINQKFK